MAQELMTRTPAASARHEAHARKVERIARQLREHPRGRPASLRKKTPPHQVPKAFDKRRTDEKIDVSDLTEILEVDPERRVCVAESGVTMFDLCRATLAHGLVPAIVPEFKTITVGGAVAGCSIESGSFRHGGFHDICREYELVTSKGEVLTCRPDNEHALIYQMLHGTFGTLGVLTKLEFDLIPAKPFVRMTREKYPSAAALKEATWRHYRDRDADFMDGILYAPDEHVLDIGRFVDQAPYTNRFDWMKIYYRDMRGRPEDYLRTLDYLFRYDRGITNVQPSSFLGRLLFGRFIGSTEVLALAEKLHWLLPKERPSVTLDVFIPHSKLEPFLDWYARDFQHFPLWYVPYKKARDYEWISSGFFERNRGEELFLDIAIYGMKQPPDGRNYYRVMEEKLLEIGGTKTLISYNFFSEDEFWSLWNRENYSRAKALTDPDNIFRDLYTKTCK